MIPTDLSDAFVDDMVSLLFVAFPSLDAHELHAVLDALLRISRREVRRALAAERQRQAARLEPRWQ